jgi:hypothetical protein
MKSDGERGMTKMTKTTLGKVMVVFGFAGVLLLGGCAAWRQGTTRQTPQGYARQKEEKDLTAYWNLTHQDGQVMARGYVQSITPPTILLRMIHLTLVGYDEKGREVIRGRPVFSTPSTLNVEEPPKDQGTFEVSLALRNAPARTFDLDIFYIWVPLSSGEPSRR